MSTTIAPPAGPARPPARRRRSPQPPVGPPARRRKAPWIAAVGGLVLLVVMPIVILAGAANPPGCAATPGRVGAIDNPGGAAPGGHFAAPLQMAPGQWYKVGATEYGPPDTGVIGSDPDPGQDDLATHPDSFAELSTLDSNPANDVPPDFTFADADALGNLPYGTNVRVRGPSGRQIVLAKRDTGYGQGPTGQTSRVIYRMDIWNEVSPILGVTKSPVAIELAPASGTAPTLGQTPAPTQPQTAGTCPAGPGALIGGPLQLTPGQTAQINLSTGDASAPQDAPTPVKLAIAAANEIHTKPYSATGINGNGDGPASHAYGPLSQIWPAYDCSASTSFVLYHAGLFGPNAWASGQFEEWGNSGPGKWVTVYANSDHVFLVIAGRAFDTADYGGPDIPDSPWFYGPRWRADPTGNLADGNAYIVRHPPGAWNE